jgi:hypothetical protein
MKFDRNTGSQHPAIIRQNLSAATSPRLGKGVAPAPYRPQSVQAQVKQAISAPSASRVLQPILSAKSQPYLSSSQRPQSYRLHAFSSKHTWTMMWRTSRTISEIAYSHQTAHISQLLVLLPILLQLRAQTWAQMKAAAVKRKPRL